MNINPFYVDEAFIELESFVEKLNELNDAEQKALAHRLFEIYRKEPKHKDWLQKLHELLDLQ